MLLAACALVTTSPIFRAAALWMLQPWLQRRSEGEAHKTFLEKVITVQSSRPGPHPSDRLHQM
jgi:hypothetical protein